MENVLYPRYNKTSTTNYFFFEKTKHTRHPSLCFNNARIQRQFIQKHLGLFLDEKLSILEHIEVKIEKATSGVNLMLLCVN